MLQIYLPLLRVQEGFCKRVVFNFKSSNLKKKKKHFGLVQFKVMRKLRTKLTNKPAKLVQLN